MQGKVLGWNRAAQDMRHATAKGCGLTEPARAPRSAMCLLKPRIMSPARISASHRNALKSTGPRIPRGNAQSRMNGPRNGSRSPTYRMLFRAFLEAPGCPVEEMARIPLTPEQARHSVFAERVDFLRAAEIEMASNVRHPRTKGEYRSIKGRNKSERS